MNILIAGGDRLGAIPEWLASWSSGQVYHWSGRGSFRQPIPPSVGMVILLANFVNHSLAARLKREAGRKGIRIIYARRSLSGLKEEIGGHR